MYSMPQYLFLYAALFSSMLAGASLVHAVLQPDLSLKTPAAAVAPAAAGTAAAVPVVDVPAPAAAADGGATSKMQ